MFECWSYIHTKKELHISFSELASLIQLPPQEFLKRLNETLPSLKATQSQMEYEIAIYHFLYKYLETNPSSDDIINTWQELLTLTATHGFPLKNPMTSAWLLEIVGLMEVVYNPLEKIKTNKKFNRKIEEFFEAFGQCFNYIMPIINTYDYTSLPDSMEPLSAFRKKGLFKDPIAIYLYVIYKKLDHTMKTLLSKYKYVELVIFLLNLAGCYNKRYNTNAY